MKYCKSCRKIFNLQDSKFCPFCGAKSPIEFRISDVVPQEGIVLGFKFKNGKKFGLIYEEMKKFDTFYEVGENNIKYCFVSVLQKNIQDLFNIFSFPFQEDEVYIFENGKRIRSIYYFKNVLTCLSKRNEFITPEIYCYGLESDSYKIPNLVGCRKMELEITEYGRIYDMGEWIDSKTYKFDKEFLLKIINSNTKNYRFCPYLQKKLIFYFFELWPEIIDLNIDKRWIAKSFSSFFSPYFVVNFQNNKVMPKVIDSSFFLDILEKLYPERNDIRALIENKSFVNFSK